MKKVRHSATRKASVICRVRKLTGNAVIVCGLSFVVTACTTLGPDYVEPEVAWMQDWSSNLYGQTGDVEFHYNLDLQFWWHLFDDPVLNNLIDSARKNNPSLRIAGLRVLESRAVLGIAGSALYPQVQQLNATASYNNIQQHGGISANRDQSFVSYQGGPTVRWELDFWGRFKRGIESADAAFFASIANQQDLQVLLSAQVADLYFAYRTTELNISAAKHNASIQKRSLEITERRFNKGQDSELDYQQSKAQYLSTLSAINDLEILLTQIRNALTAILGRAPGNLPELANESDPLPVVDPITIHDLPARLLVQRPDIRAAALQVAAQTGQIGIAEADRYPAISLLASIGWAGNTLASAAEAGSLSAGSSMIWNIFDYGRIANNVRVQDARLQQAIEVYQAQVLQAAREIDDSAVRVVKTREKMTILRESVKSAERSLELALKRYAEGYSDFQRVIDAQRVVLTQTSSEITNHGDHISAVISLYRSIGGGWSVVSIDELVPQSTQEQMKSRTDWGELLDAPLPSEEVIERKLQGVQR